MCSLSCPSAKLPWWWHLPLTCESSHLWAQRPHSLAPAPLVTVLSPLHWPCLSLPSRLGTMTSGFSLQVGRASVLALNGVGSFEHSFSQDGKTRGWEETTAVTAATTRGGRHRVNRVSCALT